MSFDLSAEALAERLTMAGLEVEGVSEFGTYEHVVVGRIVELEPHPRADRLALCTVDAGAEGRLRVVSGAPNLEAGLKVGVALPGARLADGQLVEAVDIRGVVSLAVLVSEKEIGVSDDHSGVMTLDGEMAPGTDLASIFGTRDTILEVSVTPNRGDWLSILGIAREISALTGERLRVPPARLVEKDPPSSDRIRVDVREPRLCSRYVARVVTGVQLGPSPLWMRSRLTSLGIRAINNVVDVTNYVLLERGQPLHAFDLARIGGGTIVVRRAGAPVAFRTLDGEERRLEAEDLVIADAERPVAVAGVMGGADSAVGEATSEVLIEAAWFAPSSVRRTSRRLGLRSEASMRFERGVDVEGVPAAAARATELLAKLARGQVARGAVDAYPSPEPPAEVLVRPDRANRLLGTAFSVAEISQSLRRVSASVKAAGKGGYLCRPPAYRSDLTREADFVEEIARLAGYDRVPASEPLGRLGGGGERGVDLRRRARDLLVGQGATEMSCRRFVSTDWNARIRGLAAGDERPIRIVNPLASDASEMRLSLLPGLLAAARHNVHQGEAWVRAFELGTVFALAPDGRPRERLAVGGVLRGPLPPRGTLSEGRAESFHDAKGVVEALVEGLRVASVRFARQPLPAFLHPGKSAAVLSGDALLGWVGGLHPAVSRAADLAGEAWAFELDFKKLEFYCSPAVSFQPLPKYPAVLRDLAVVVDEAFEAQSLLDAVARARELPVERIRLFDVYRGAPLAPGKKSLAYSIAYRAADRTLTDAEVSRLHQQLVARVVAELGVELRA